MDGNDGLNFNNYTKKNPQKASLSSNLLTSEHSTQRHMKTEHMWMWSVTESIPAASGGLKV